MSDLDFLKQVREVSEVNLSELENLRNLEGPIYLDSIDTLRLSSLPKIKNLKGMKRVESIGTFILVDLVSFESFDGISENLEVGTLQIVRLPKLVNLVISSGRITIISELDISDSQGLQNLTGPEYSNAIRIQLYRLVLEDLRGLEMITHLMSLQIEDMPNIKNLLGIDNMVSIGAMIVNDSSLSNLSSLRKLVSVGLMQLDRLSNLKNLSGLENLRSVEGNIEITNTSVESVDDLHSTLKIGGQFIFNEQVIELDRNGHIVRPGKEPVR